MGLLRMISEQELEISCAVQNSGNFNALILLSIKDKIVAGVEASQVSSQFISAPPHFWLTSEKQIFYRNSPTGGTPPRTFGRHIFPNFT